MTFDLTIFDNKESLDSFIQTLIQKRDKLGQDLYKTKDELALKGQLTIQIIILSEISEIDY